jgi:hypothetical protein
MQMQTVSFRIDASKVHELDMLAQTQSLRRTDLIVAAVDAYILSIRDRSKEPVKGFGLWKDTPEDGLEYQERLRSEWERL